MAKMEIVKRIDSEDKIDSDRADSEDKELNKEELKIEQLFRG